MLLALAAALLLGAAPGQGLIITQDTPVVVPPGSLNSTAFTLAWRDVQQDWYRVLGKLPFVFDAVPGNESLTFTSFGNGTVGPVAQPVVVFLGHASDVAALLPAVAAPLAGALRGPESHTCCQYPFNASLGYAPLVCGGADELGSVYAAYTLSHSVLGVDPQYFFTDNDPAYAGSVDPAANPDVAACKVHSLTKDSFRYRGFFVNDEDLLGGFKRDPAGGSAFSVAAWDRVFEYILRLRGNAVIVGTAAYPDEESFDQAARRGLHLAQHHITVLGTNVFRWPPGVPYSFRTAPEVLTDLWTRLARLQLSRGRKMLWTVGYRGLNDYPFWVDDPTINTPAKRGAVISAAIQQQVDVVHSVAKEMGVQPGAFVTYLWAEMTSLYVNGYLKVPDCVTVVHGDNGDGIVPDPSTIKAGDGLYYHVAMESDRANQLTEMVPPARIAEQLLAFIQRGATTYIILNTSDMRPVPLGTRLVMDWAWNAAPLMQAASPMEAANAAVAAWAARQYGSAAASRVASVLQAYFNASMFHDASVSPNPPGLLPNYDQGCRFQWEHVEPTTTITTRAHKSLADTANSVAGEQHLSVLVRDIAFLLARDLRCAASEGKPPTTVSAQLRQLAAQAADLVHQTQPSLLRNRALARSARDEVPAARRQFWDAHVGGQSQLYAEAIGAVANLTTTVSAVVAGDASQAQVYAAKALGATEGVLAALRLMEQSLRWKGVHAYDVLDGWQNVHDHVKGLLSALHGLSHPPVTRFWRWGTGNWNYWFSYMHWDTFPFQNPNTWLEAAPRPFMPVATTVACSEGQDQCTVTPLGVTDKSGASSVALLLNRPDVALPATVPACPGSLKILYSKNTSAPVGSWAEAPRPLHISENVTVSAAVACTEASPAWYGTLTRFVVTRLSP